MRFSIPVEALAKNSINSSNKLIDLDIFRLRLQTPQRQQIML
jgi:hypothetical protein